jgi:hypothetical protein
MAPRRRHNDRTLYLAAWETAGIVKIGFTDHLTRRLRSFTGATIPLTLTFPDSITGYDFEIVTHQEAYRRWPRAFTDRIQAIPFLGGNGFGYLECYRATATEALDLIASQYSVTIRRHDKTSQCDVTIRRHIATSRSYERTDGLTEIRGFRDGKIFRYVTRGRAGRFFRLAAIGGAS